MGKVFRDADYFLKEGDDWFAKKDYERAVLSFLSALKEEPHCVSAYRKLATVYSVDGDPERAIESLKKAGDLEKQYGDGTTPGASRQENELKYLLKEDVLNIFTWSPRVEHCFQHGKIKTVGDLLAYSEEKLMTVKGFGRKSLTEVKGALKSIGLELSPDRLVAKEV